MKDKENTRSNDMKIAILEVKNSHIYETLIRLERKMDEGFNKIDQRFESIDRKFEFMDKKLDSMDKKIDDRFNNLNNRMWQIIFWSFSSFAGVLYLIAKSSHWL